MLLICYDTDLFIISTRFIENVSFSKQKYSEECSRDFRIILVHHSQCSQGSETSHLYKEKEDKIKCSRQVLAPGTGNETETFRLTWPTRSPPSTFHATPEKTLI